MAEDARLGGGVSTRSDGNQARELGVCRHTIRRWKCQLERSGAIVRDGYHVWHPRCKTVRYRIATQGSGEARKTSRTLRFATSSRRASASTERCGRRRKLMEKHPDVLPGGIVRKSGEVTPFNAGDAIAATVDVCREMGIPVAPQIKARLGKGSKGLIESGFPPNIVVAACVTAIRTGWFGSVESIAQEMVVATAGGRIARSEYLTALAETAHKIDKDQSPVWQTMREEMARRAERLS